MRSQQGKTIIISSTHSFFDPVQRPYFWTPASPNDRKPRMEETNMAATSILIQNTCPDEVLYR